MKARGNQMLLNPAEPTQAVLRDSAPAAERRPSPVRQPPHSCYPVQPLMSRPVGFAFLAPRPPFRAVQPGKQHQNRAGPHDSHREYQCDRFLRAHETILRATSDLSVASTGRKQTALCEGTSWNIR
jgi:hypothetical protein